MPAATPEDFDPQRAVDQYRRAIESLEAQTDESGRQEFGAIVARLRKQWEDWQGEDSLHEMAFGEPT
jgi:hypothetical protein